MTSIRIAGVALAVVLSALLPASGQAPSQQQQDAMAKCAAITDDHARLACYDAASHQKSPAAVPPAALPGNREPTVEEQKSWFGFDLSGLFGGGSTVQSTPQQFGNEELPQTQQKVATAETEIGSISASVTKVTLSPFGRFTVFLDNGQVWRQIEGDVDRAMFRNPANENKVTIERGFIGSYNMTLNGSEKIYKVKRLQ
jgi:hypothetical protein